VPLNPKDPVVSAREAGLRYVTDQLPGIRRLNAGRGFRYVDPHGRVVRDRSTLARIRSLVIPPKWSSVWICPLPAGHLQVTARDARGRKQYRYHPRYRAVRDETKYESMVEFGRVLPRIRSRVYHDLKRRGLPKEKVLAAVVRILDTTRIRVGNAEYARDNDSYGLTTLRNSHVAIAGSKVRFRFNGKSKQVHSLELDDPKLASVVRRCRDLPGYQLFQYVDSDDQPQSIDSTMVNDYLREITGQNITAKDFRTWHGTVQAAVQLCNCGDVVQAVKSVAQILGNRPAACRKYYIHPLVLAAHDAGSLAEKIKGSSAEIPARGLSPAEKCVLSLLEASRHRRRTRAA
jgi:DNA topoisomerase I